MRVLIIDACNIAYRAWSAVHIVNDSGENVGGAVGFIRIIKCIIRDLKPDRVIASWDSNGSQARKKLYPAYKATRKPEHQDYTHQIELIQSILPLINIPQVSIPDVESDDQIAYIAQQMFSDDEKIIVSADGDMLQLVRKDIKIWNPDSKTLIDPVAAVQKIEVLPENFAILKAFTGDTSDNIDGIPGIGAKTAMKLFPDLALRPVSLQDICDQTGAAIKHEKGFSSMYMRLTGHWNKFMRNYELMNLCQMMLNEQQIDSIHDQLSIQSIVYNREEFEMALRHIGVVITDRDFSQVIEDHIKRAA